MSPFERERRSRWEGWLPRFSLSRPITVVVLIAATLVVGLVAALGIPLETFPQGFTAPFLTVVVPWPDAQPQEVLDKIVKPLEDELSTVRGLDRLNSLANESRGIAFMSFKQGTDMDVAYREVRDRVQRVRPQLPDDADRVFIRKQDLSSLPVFMIGLAVDPELTDYYHLIQNEVVMPLERLDGVASVEPNGLEEKEILIEVDRQRAASAGLNIYQLAQELGGDNFTMASGSVRSGGSKLLLRSVARYPDLETLENRLVAPSVRLKDVAEVKYEEPEQDYRARVNGQPAVAVMVFKEGQANTLQVSSRINDLVEEMQENPRLQHLEIVPFFNQGQIILSSLGSLMDSGRIGGLFAVVVLFFFLRRFRMTLIITLSIPLSLLIALTTMYFAGETLNFLTLLGLMICVGLLVDNSVVVAENIHRLHRQGASRREAAVRGAGEISLAIVMATLTTIAVFLPISLVSGQAQFFLLRLSIPISVALAASLVVALVFVPLAAYLTLPRRGEVAKESAFRRGHRRLNRVLKAAYEGSLGRINRLYNRQLGVALNRRIDLVISIFLLTVITGAAFKVVEFVPQQDSERAALQLNVTLPNNFTIEDTAEYFEAAEQVMVANQERWDLSGFFTGIRRTRGEIQAWFNSPRTTETAPREITEQIVEALPEAPGVQIFTGEQSRVSECDGKGVHCIQLYADDSEILETVREDLEDLFRQIPGVVGIQRSDEQSPNQLALVVDRDRAQQQGVNPQVVAGVVSYALRGQSLPKYYRDGREIPVRVRFQEENRESLAELGDFSVPTGDGSAVALSTLTEADFSPAPRAIFRRDKRTSATIAMDLASGEESEARERVDAFMEGLDLPEGVTFGTPARASANEDMESLLFAAGLSIIFIYLLMAFLFESFILPLSIVLTIPLAFIGVVWIHVVTGYDIDFLGGVAAVLLIGVVVNNGIVLIDYINRLRGEGHSRRDAVLLSAERRFRPIMMTALTTICATVPLAAAGPTDIGMSYTSFGLSLIGGMTTSTLLTLLVVPVFYTLFDDAREALTGAVRRGVLGKGQQEPAGEPVTES
ncbi:MAG: efflux RND transporter permease subunit [Acidobacteriota bacterium]|nr:efflux RND transporter permease subunit [Acidobacteriota bacterium]